MAWHSSSKDRSQVKYNQVLKVRELKVATQTELGIKGKEVIAS